MFAEEAKNPACLAKAEPLPLFPPHQLATPHYLFFSHFRFRSEMRATLLSYALFVTLFAQIQALYYIDDADKRITYASSTAGKGYSRNWRHLNQEKDNGLAVAVDEKMCFGGTA